MASSKTAEKAEKALEEKEAEKVVRYIGTSNERLITEADFKTAGIEHETLRWERDAPLNDVKLSDINLSDTDFARVILADRDFRVIEVQRA